MDFGSNEGGVTVSMVRNGTTISSTTSSSNGKYSLTAVGPKLGKYEIIYSKPGMVTKKIAFDGSKMNEEDIPAGNEIPFPTLDMDLFAQRDNVDFSFLNTEYVASFYWNDRQFSLDFDRVASEKVRKKIDELLLKSEKDKAEADMKYQQAIKNADMAFNQKKYEEARSKYEEALGYKPMEKYPADRLNECDALILAQKQAALAEEQANAEYNNLIKAADNLKAQDKLPEALAKYQEALAKKDEQYPKDQIAALKIEIENRKKEAENAAAYDAAITKADMFLKQNSLQAARDKYTEASKLKPSEKYPKDKLAEIEAKMKEQEQLAEKKAKYDAAITAGDAAFNGEDYQTALAKYKEALTFESASSYAKDRVKLCEAKISEANLAAEKAKKIDELIKQGNAALPLKDYTTAKAKFQEVLGLDPENGVAKEKLDFIKQKQEEEAALAEQQKEYINLIKAGDAAMTGKKFEEAITKYEAAIAINKTAEAENKLKEAKAQLTALEKANEMKAAYDKAMQEGDQLLASEKLEEAKAKYQQASSIDPTQNAPKDKIKQVDKLIQEKADTAAKIARIEALVKEGDHNFANAKWDEAAKKYREAMVLDPSNTYAKQRVSEIETIIQKEKESAARKAQIDGLLTEARNLKTQSKLPESKKKLEEVLALEPANTEANALINEVNNLIAAKQSQAEKEGAFNKLKAEGFDLAAKKNYNDAKIKLQEALTLKDDGAVRTKLAEVEQKIAEENQLADLNNRYDNLLTEANTLQSKNDYKGAIAKYQAALGLKPSESLPKQKIEELQKLIQADANQAQVDAEYNKIMKAGDALMASEKYLDAIKEYNKALTLKPNEQEPVDKAAEAERLERQKGQEVDAQYEKILTVAEEKMNAGDYDRALELVNRATTLKPEDPRPKNLLQRINQLKADEAAYKAFMTDAQALELAKKYPEAKAKYSSALSKKPSDQLATDKIAEMQRLIDENQNKAQTEALYAEYMANGAKYFGKQSYEQALSEYQNALSVKPNDNAAQNKINEIEQILDNIANANQNELDKKNEFDRLVKAADGKFGSEDYLAAKGDYEKALNIDPSSSYVKKQIDECIKQERAKGNVEAEREYMKIIEAADKNFDKASYDKAKNYYERALTLKNNDPYPKQKLAEIQAILNPSTVASAELEDLGEPFDNSIMDGQALLEKADAQRKSLKGTRMKKGIDKIHVAESDMTSQKTQDHYENSNEIYQVQMLIIRNEGESDLGRQETIDAIRKSEFERQNVEAENISYEHADNILNQDVLYAVNNEVAIDYGIRESVYTENADLLESYNTAQAERIRIEIDLDKGRNIDTDQDLTKVKLQIDEGVRDDYDERAEVRDDVVAAEKFAVDVQKGMTDSSYDKVLSNKDEVRKIELAYDSKAVEDARSSGLNEQELVSVRENVNDAELIRTEVKEAHLYKTDREIAGVKEKVSADQIQSDDNRKNTVEVLKQGNKELADANYNAYNDELVKYVTNKEIINEEVNINNGISEKADIALEKKIAYVELMDKKAEINYEEDALSDEVERQNAKKGIEAVYTSVEATAGQEKDKLEANTSTLSDVSRTIEADKTNQTIGEQDKHYDAQAKISDVDTRPKPKVITANELGGEYPEGVSQENFTINDDDGLMTAIITRRIVVIEGHASVYVRTQTLHGITYTKNDQPSLEHVWNKETQGPHLERHY